MSSGVSSALDTALDRTIAPGYSRIGFEIRRRLWGDEHLPRLDGQTVAITGATSGLGESAAVGVAVLGATVLLLVRDRERGEGARARIAAAAGDASAVRERLHLIECDVADRGSVRRGAEEILEHHPRVRVLINNAGVLPAERTLSPDGIELTFATNVVGPFLLTGLLVPALAAAAPARVINVSSGGMYSQRIKVDDLEMEHEAFDGVVAYARSKRAEVILAGMWAQRLRPLGIFAHSMHPGWVDTPGVQTSLPRFHRLTKPILRTPEQGADTIVWLAAAELPGIVTGGFWHDRRQRTKHVLGRTRETAAEREQLWRRCAELAGWDPVVGIDDFAPGASRKAQ
jgi:NAD(P)-dependent dehydrogenase (short-subunit alcohol dehydrogenase family)